LNFKLLLGYHFFFGGDYQVDISLFCLGIKIALRWFKMRPWKEMPLGKLTLAKTWGKKGKI